MSSVTCSRADKLAREKCVAQPADFEVEVVEQHLQVELRIVKSFDRSRRRQQVSQTLMLERGNLKQIDDEGVIGYCNLDQPHPALKRIQAGGLGVDTEYRRLPEMGDCSVKQLCRVDEGVGF